MPKTWTHNICGLCWAARYNGKPGVLTEPTETTCCYCGKPTSEGMFLRRDPNAPELHCKGEH